MFKKKIDKTMEVYIDDMLIKSLDIEDHLSHLNKTFDILRKHNMKLNPHNWAFRVGSGTILGLLISNKGEVTLEKIKAIIGVIDEVNVVQRLIEYVITLSRFISRSSKRWHCFF